MTKTNQPEHGVEGSAGYIVVWSGSVNLVIENNVAAPELEVTEDRAAQRQRAWPGCPNADNTASENRSDSLTQHLGTFTERLRIWCQNLAQFEIPASGSAATCSDALPWADAYSEDAGPGVADPDYDPQSEGNDDDSFVFCHHASADAQAQSGAGKSAQALDAEISPVSGMRLASGAAILLHRNAGIDTSLSVLNAARDAPHSRWDGDWREETLLCSSIHRRNFVLNRAHRWNAVYGARSGLDVLHSERV